MTSYVFIVQCSNTACYVYRVDGIDLSDTIIAIENIPTDSNKFLDLFLISDMGGTIFKTGRRPFWVLEIMIFFFFLIFSPEEEDIVSVASQRIASDGNRDERPTDAPVRSRRARARYKRVGYA